MHYTSQLTNLPTILLSSIKSKTNNRKHKKHFHHNTKNRFSSPTPLIIPQTPYTQTKFQALEAVVADLESTIKNGITIDDTHIFASLLETCFTLRSVDHGIRVHRLIPESIIWKNPGISSKLLRIYALGGLIEDAHQVFDKMSKRNECVFAWNSLISGYSELGLYEDAMALYFQMEEEGVEPDEFTFPRVMKACGGIGSVRIGEAVHRHAIRSGFASDGFVLNSLVDMYAKCGDIVKARKVFDKMPNRDLVSWNSIIVGYIRHGLVLEALNIFRQMLLQGFDPDSVTVSAILTGVSSIRIGIEIHGWVLRQGMNYNLSIANSLIMFYSKYRKLIQSSRLFDEMPERDVVSWNVIISAHSKDPKALSYFRKMAANSVVPNAITFVSLLSTCAHLGLVSDGERFFSTMKNRYGIVQSMEHYACMVNLYGRAGLIDKAYEMVANRVELEAGPTLWGALLFACYLHNNVDVGEIAAHRLIELEPDNEHNFELLMKIYANAGRTEDVEKVRMMMVERGLDS